MRISSTTRKVKKSIATRETPALRKFRAAADAGKTGNYRLAVQLLGELISETEAPPEAWLLLGRSLHALKDYSRALAAFNDYIRQKPLSGEGYFFAGRSYLSAGMPYRAVPLLRKALAFSPGASSDLQNAEFRSKTKALLGTAYLKSKHSQAAVEILQEAVEGAPNDMRIYRAYLNSLLVRGIRLCRMEDYELGRQILLFVLSNRGEAGMSESPILRLELGRAARETGRLEEALEHFTAALKLTGNSASGAGDANTKGGEVGDRRIRWSRASILMALGRTPEALQEIEKIRSRDTGVPELPWNNELVDLFMIRSFLETGKWREATEACRDWLKLRGESPIIHALYAEALRNMGNCKFAHNHLQRALEKEPKELDFWYADILVCWEGNDYKSMKWALKAAKSLGGDEDLLKRFSVLCQIRTTKDTPGIITILQKAIRSMGPEPEFMYALGEAYLKIGLLKEAESWFKKTISLKKNHESAWLGQIAALEALLTEESPGSDMRSPIVDRLASLYKAYLKIWPSNVNIHRDRAMFLIKTFEFDEASAELERLLAWEPSNPSLRRVLAYTYRKTGRYREAAVFLKYLLKEKPQDISLLIEYTGCLDRAGAARHALELLEMARKHFKSSARKQEMSDISLALGIICIRQKKVEKAFDCFREAAALNPKDPRPYEWMTAVARKNRESNSSYYEKEALKRKNRDKNSKK